MVLDDKACPAQLQSVYPHQGTKFTLQMRRGGPVKVHYGSLIPGTEYKSILLSANTSVDELIQLILNSNQCPESPSLFSLHEVFPAQNLDRRLHGDEYPLRIQEEWPTHDLVFFQLRRNCITSSETPPLPPKRRVVSLLTTFTSFFFCFLLPKQTRPTVYLQTFSVNIRVSLTADQITTEVQFSFVYDNICNLVSPCFPVLMCFLCL